MNLVRLPLITLLLFHVLHFCTSIDTITTSYSIRDGDVLVSKGQIFTLGFFSPGNSTHRYVGIWYHKVSEQTVVWVANRDNPINDASGVLAISNQGNLVLYEKNRAIPVWSTNVSASPTNNCKAQLLDSGNFVLVQQDSKRIIWQSFDHPTDTLLPYMKIGLDRRTGLNWFLSSWKSKDDPGTGTIFYKIDPTGFPQLFLYKGPIRLWRGGPWTGQGWSGIPQLSRDDIQNASFVNNKDELSTLYGLTNASVISRVVVNESGSVHRFTWNDHEHRWIQFGFSPQEECDNYAQCGANSNCDPYHAYDFFCKCLPGYEPKSPRDWYLRDGLRGCIRKPGVSMCQSGEGFVKVSRVRVPDTSVARADMSLSFKACGQECLKNCSCTAYTSADERGIGCLTWYGDLIDTRTYSDAGQDVYIRVDAAELAKYKNSNPLAKKGMQALLIVSIAVTLLLLVSLACWLVRRKRKCSLTAKDRGSIFSFTFTTSLKYLRDSPVRKKLDESRSSDLTLFDLSAIVAATNNFSNANKLGQGGFGSVYKGLLQNGKEIAVKRLSQYSAQGVDEFTNEIALIAKLQHRNLVRMLGCCIQDPEKMLIYEYLPNKSLDYFIFDETRRILLDWPTRYNIICGIARGILYLHQDSRLRIIHRDLKASNVLLDASMNPKISDFGMARIFAADQIEANTKRIVGTYGYMSPEYAMQGLFSIKSDVYSFGVLLVEVITGIKNSSYYHESTSSSLVGHVWNLWRESRALEIVDASLGDSCPDQEVLRCIQIGLLCVQESAMDRPTMSNVVFMLSKDTTLPSPKQPAFILNRTHNSKDALTSGGANSVNSVTISALEAR